MFFGRIIELVAEFFGSTKEQLRQKGFKHHKDRSIAIDLSKIYSAEKGAQIAQRFGMGSTSAATMRYKAALKKRRGQKIGAQN